MFLCLKVLVFAFCSDSFLVLYIFILVSFDNGLKRHIIRSKSNVTCSKCQPNLTVEYMLYLRTKVSNSIVFERTLTELQLDLID